MQKQRKGFMAEVQVQRGLRGLLGLQEAEVWLGAFQAELRQEEGKEAGNKGCDLGTMN